MNSYISQNSFEQLQKNCDIIANNQSVSQSVIFYTAYP